MKCGKYFINVYKHIINKKIYTVDTKKLYKEASNVIMPIITFIKLLVSYLVCKYYYKLTEIDFIMKVYTDPKIGQFFITLNKLKTFFVGERPCKYKLLTSMMYYYLIMLIAFIYYVPFTWFMLRVLTDAQNWMIYYLEVINLGLAL